MQDSSKDNVKQEAINNSKQPGSDIVEAGDITILLQKAHAGDSPAVEALIPHIYDNLRRLAQKQMRAERDNHTLQPTALVHEAYLKLINQNEQSFANRLHFFSIAAKQMRRILIDHARAKQAAKRGGSYVKVSDWDGVGLGEIEAVAEESREDLLQLNQALEELEQISQKQAKVVELKFFAGCTNEDIAQVLGVSLATVKREWALARTWLKRELA